MSTEPVFNTFQRKPYRPFYSLREFQAGAAVVAVIAVIVGWVVWRGAHPDPRLFRADERLLANTAKGIPVYKRPLKPWVEPGSEHASAATGSSAVNHAPFPSMVESDAWKAAGGVQQFDNSNLYVKIDGREPFYKSFGFQRLYFLSLASATQKDLTIDIELFDMGSIENAIGTFAAEITRPDVELTAGASGFFYASRNSGFLAHGRYYARMIGSDDSETVRTRIQELRAAFIATLPGDKLPGAYALFIGKLRLNPRQVHYYPVEAFSFGFANEVYSGKIKDDTEVFLSHRRDAADAGALAAKFIETLRGYGKTVSAPAGVTLVRNEYVTAFDAISTEGPYVIGVRMAASAEEALRWLEAIRQPVRELKTDAIPAAKPAVASDGSEGEH